MTKEDCAAVFARLSEYLDRELPDISCEDIERHIADCAPCIQFVQSLRKSIALTRGFSDVEQPSHLSDEMRQKLRSVFDAQIPRRDCKGAG